MTDFEINKAIAEVCGWKIHHMDRYLITDPKYPHSVQPIGTIPNYCNDLNAMHEAEKSIQENKRVLYGIHLAWICGHTKNVGLWHISTATAKNRAEAFLKTFEQWEEAK